MNHESNNYFESYPGVRGPETITTEYVNQVRVVRIYFQFYKGVTWINQKVTRFTPDNQCIEQTESESFFNHS